jgi:hypothetical protein
VHLLHGRRSKKKPKINPVSGESSADRRAAELTAKFASISNDRLIARDSQDELLHCSIPGGPSIPVDVLSEVVTDEVLHRAIFKALVGSSAGEDGIPAGILRAVWQSPNGRSVLRLIDLSSLSLCHVPTSWKRAIIHPIPKPKYPEFRPISLLSQIGKICEKIVTWFLQSEATVRPNQLECRPYACAIDAARLAHHSSAVRASLKRSFAGIFLDITKA